LSYDSPNNPVPDRKGRLTLSALRLGEAEPQPFQGEPAALADDEVVEQLDIELLPGRHDLHGEGHIGRRGRQIPGRVVMDGNEGSGLLADRVPEDITLPSSTCGSQEQASGQRVRTAGAESQDVVGKRNVSQSVAVTTPPQWAMARSMAGYGALILARKRSIDPGNLALVVEDNHQVAWLDEDIACVKPAGLSRVRKQCPQFGVSEQLQCAQNRSSAHATFRAESIADPGGDG